MRHQTAASAKQGEWPSGGSAAAQKRNNQYDFTAIAKHTEPEVTQNSDLLDEGGD